MKKLIFSTPNNSPQMHVKLPIRNERSRFKNNHCFYIIHPCNVVVTVYSSIMPFFLSLHRKYIRTISSKKGTIFTLSSFKYRIGVHKAINSGSNTQLVYINMHGFSNRLGLEITITFRRFQKKGRWL